MELLDFRLHGHTWQTRSRIRGRAVQKGGPLCQGSVIVSALPRPFTQVIILLFIVKFVQRKRKMQIR